MTAEDRRRVREARDALARNRMLLERQALPVLFCSGCGMELDEWTPGCRTCCDRWWSYKRRGSVDPEVYRQKALAGKMWGIVQHGRHNREHPRRIGHQPATTWQQNREALGVKNGGRLVRTPRGLI